MPNFRTLNPINKFGLALIGICAASLVTVTGQAFAGNYFIEQCTPTVPSISPTVTTEEPGDKTHTTNRCETKDRYLSIRSGRNAHHAGWFLGYSFRAPSEAQFTAMSLKAHLNVKKETGGDPYSIPAIFYPDDFLLSSGKSGGERIFSSFQDGMSLRVGYHCFGGSNGKCSRTGCVGSGECRSSVRDVRLTVADEMAPTQTRSGQLFSGEIVNGSTVSANVVGRDGGGGVEHIAVTVNEIPLSGVLSDCTGYVEDADRGRVSKTQSPCPAESSHSFSSDTTRYPFREGSNEVQTCVADTATTGQPNVGCRTSRVVVDNVAPAAAENPTLSHEHHTGEGPYAGEELEGDWFTYSWDNPSADIEAVELRYMKLGGPIESIDQRVDGSDIESLDFHAHQILPEPGCYLTSIRLIDGVDQVSPWTSMQRLCFREDPAPSAASNLRVTHAITGNHPYRGEEMPNGSFRLAWQNTEPDIAGAKLRISRYRDRPEGETREGWERLAISRTTKTFSGENLRRIYLRGRGLHRPGCYALVLRLVDRNGSQSEPVEPQTELCVQV